jgi:DNA-binding transcriptional regulator YhcF (GntR family)
MVQLNIVRDSDTPVYRQIIESITALIQKGELNPGDKLPAERDLAADLDIARGTIKKAYQELERNRILECTRGRGTFVAREQDVVTVSRKESAIKTIDRSITELMSLKFSFREISTFFHLRLMELRNESENVHIAAVDCNPEALAVFQKQLSHISYAQMHKYLLDGIIQDPGAEKTLAAYDLIITTTTHYSDVISLVPALKERISQAAVSPSQQTIIDIAKIPASAKVCILCESEKFLQIVKERLKAFQINMSQVESCLFRENRSLKKILEGKAVLLHPKHYAVIHDRDDAAVIQRCAANGLRVVEFDYMIERGSLIHIEERISSILQER